MFNEEDAIIISRITSVNPSLQPGTPKDVASSSGQILLQNTHSRRAPESMVASLYKPEEDTTLAKSHSHFLSSTFAVLRNIRKHSRAFSLCHD